MPKILLIQLNRVSHEDCLGRDESAFSFPEEYNFSLLLGIEKRYKLQTVVVHQYIGERLEHYKVIIKRVENWTEFNYEESYF
jgi:Ubiquitin carboxyl-terminal hydrolase